MVVEKSTERHPQTLAYGALLVRETVRVCANGCRHQDGTRIRRRAEALSEHVLPGASVGYDVMVHVGLARRFQHRQREEIRQELEAGHGIRVSSGEVSRLDRRFLDDLRALHEERSPQLAAAFAQDGGWPLHVDATGEGGRGTLLAMRAGWRKWVLGAFKVTTERADTVLPCLLEVVDRFGDPCAVVRDLGRAMIPAVADLVTARGLDIPVLSCHLHFLADLGGDLLKSGHDALAETFRRTGVKAALRTLARDLGRRLGPDIASARTSFVAWQKDETAGHQLPSGQEGLAVVRGLAQWVLDYPALSTYGTFPFDRPWLDLYDRVLTSRRAADAFLRGAPDDRAVRTAISRFCRALDPVAADQEAARVAAALRRRAVLFDELRDLLRIVPSSADKEHARSPGQILTPEEAAADLRNIEADLDHWRKALLERRPARGPANELRQAIDDIIAHLDRHGDSLWGHAIKLPAAAGGGVRLVDRTNNLMENGFRDFKHGERRRSGRKILSQDLESLPAEALLVENLRHPDYVQILCGSLDQLPQAFSALDRRRQDALREQATPITPRVADPEATTETASLPAADRKAVRTKTMDDRVRKAARSRAPRTQRMAG